MMMTRSQSLLTFVYLFRMTASAFSNGISTGGTKVTWQSPASQYAVIPKRGVAIRMTMEPTEISYTNQDWSKLDIITGTDSSLKTLYSPLQSILPKQEEVAVGSLSFDPSSSNSLGNVELPASRDLLSILKEGSSNVRESFDSEHFAFNLPATPMKIPSIPSITIEPSKLQHTFLAAKDSVSEQAGSFVSSLQDILMEPSKILEASSNAWLDPSIASFHPVSKKLVLTETAKIKVDEYMAASPFHDMVVPTDFDRETALASLHQRLETSKFDLPSVPQPDFSSLPPYLDPTAMESSVAHHLDDATAKIQVLLAAFDPSADVLKGLSSAFDLTAMTRWGLELSAVPHTLLDFESPTFIPVALLLFSMAMTIVVPTINSSSGQLEDLGEQVEGLGNHIYDEPQFVETKPVSTDFQQDLSLLYETDGPLIETRQSVGPFTVPSPLFFEEPHLAEQEPFAASSPLLSEEPQFVEEDNSEDIIEFTKQARGVWVTDNLLAAMETQLAHENQVSLEAVNVEEKLEVEQVALGFVDSEDEVKPLVAVPRDALPETLQQDVPSHQEDQVVLAPTNSPVKSAVEDGRNTRPLPSNASESIILKVLNFMFKGFGNLFVRLRALQQLYEKNLSPARATVGCAAETESIILKAFNFSIFASQKLLNQFSKARAS